MSREETVARVADVEANGADDSFESSEDAPLVGTELQPMSSSGSEGGAQASHGNARGQGGFKGYYPLPDYIKSSASALWDYQPQINWMLVFVPLALLCKAAGMAPGFVFFTSLLGLIPLAALLGCTTEALASYTNQTLGGLLNATFGNATEVIISAIALVDASYDNNMLRVIQLSLLGSILSNLLLVLGCAFLFGGCRMMSHPTEEKRKSMQTYNPTAASTNGSMLTLGVITLVFPDVLAQSGVIGHCEVLDFSRYVSLLMLVMYGVYLWFQLRTHQDLFEDEDEEEEDEDLGLYGSLAWMGVLTLFISVLSELLVEAIEPTSEDWGVPYLFIGVILIPIVGNAAEHATAVLMAWRDKMEIAMGVAVGSSVQVSIFVIPFMVIVAWTADVPLSLDFHPFETATVAFSVILVNIIISKGNSTYLEGVMLLMVYVIIGLGFILHVPEEELCELDKLCGWEQLACLSHHGNLTDATALDAGGRR